MNYQLLPEAESELVEAMAFYDTREPRLGLELAEEVYATLARIAENPSAWPVLRKPTRRATTHRFPYSIYFTVEADGILVVAIMHSSQKPGYWQDRLR